MDSKEHGRVAGEWLGERTAVVFGTERVGLLSTYGPVFAAVLVGSSVAYLTVPLLKDVWLDVLI